MPYSTKPRSSASSSLPSYARVSKKRAWRRKVVVALVAYLKKRKRSYTQHRKYARQSWSEWVQFLDAQRDDREFRSHYRLPYRVFEEVLRRIKHRIERSSKQQTCAGGAPIDAETMLAVTLRWLAGRPSAS